MYDIEEDWIKVVRLMMIENKIKRQTATEKEVEYYNKMKGLLDEYKKLSK